ncbi:MAG TPA: glycoside hydrolase family 28 protein [Bacteroidota bacterium]|nr:glycoside hydrolase family 28 protein [Bacteroidota bacterium]
MITDFGAVARPGIKNTAAIQRTIDTAAFAGGGCVVVPPGEWLTGAIRLKSNIDLVLEKGSVLLFSQDPADYLPVVFARHEDIECYKYSSFIYADHCSNIAITGEGTLNGQGKPWWEWKTSKRSCEEELEAMGAKGVPVTERVFDGSNGRVLRPAFFQPMNCTNVLVEGVTFLYGAFWTITPTYCDKVIIRGVTVRTEGSYGHTPNGDGIDPSSSTNVLIEECTFDTGDDCIAIKSGRDADGLRVHAPTANVVIRHCVGLAGHGGIVVGSETSGGIRNVYATDCTFHGTERIVRIKTARGRGGAIEHMWFRNLTADTITQEVIHINMLYTGNRLPAEKVTPTTPTISDLHFAKISCGWGKRSAIQITGIPEMPVSHITFDSITIGSAEGVVCSDADNITFRDLSVHPQSGPLLSFVDCVKVTVTRIVIPEGHESIVLAEGPKTGAVTISPAGGTGRNIAVHYGPDASHDAVKIE